MNGTHLYRIAHFLYWRTADAYELLRTNRLEALPRAVKVEMSEWTDWQEMPIERRLWLWRNGFFSHSDAIYDLDEYGPDAYFSDMQRERAEHLNGRSGDLLRNKLVFHWMMDAFPERRPPVYGLLRDDRFHDVADLDPVERVDADGEREVSVSRADRTTDPVETLETLLEDGRVVVKPTHGAVGIDVRVIEADGDAYVVNGERLDRREFVDLVGRLDETLVCGFVDQAEYAAELYPDATNTIRVVTMWDDDAGEVYVPIAVHRMGTDDSAPLDNWSQGGLSAEVDRETGELGKGIQHPKWGRRRRYASHPDTGTRIQGRQVPGWDAIREEVLEMAATFSHIPYVGWDVLVTGPEEFVILEGNKNTDVDLLQVHRPLLRDERARRFYERHGVL